MSLEAQISTGSQWPYEASNVCTALNTEVLKCLPDSASGSLDQVALRQPKMHSADCIGSAATKQRASQPASQSVPPVCQVIDPVPFLLHRHKCTRHATG